MNSTKKTDSWKYVWNQFKKLYPMYISSFFVTFIIRNYVKDIPFRKWGELLWNTK